MSANNAKDEPARECVKVERYDDGVHVLVCTIDWDAPSRPVLTWRLAQKLASDASEADVEKAIQDVIAAPSYFATCEECGRRNPHGWMFDEQLCQACAEENHGVVY